MKTFISMLRGINVSGQKMIRMAELKSLYESLGFVHVTTYVQSGNVVFASAECDIVNLTTAIETQIEKIFGYTVSVLMRDTSDFQRIIASNPFVHERQADPAKLHVTFLERAPSEAILNALTRPSSDGDECVIGDRAIYLFCPNGYGRTKLSNTFFEKRLKVAATTRNWKTVNALHHIAIGIPV